MLINSQGCIYYCYYYTRLMASFSWRTTNSWVSWYQKGKTSLGWYQKGKTSLDLNEARDGGVLGWQWHQLDHMQTICTLLQTDSTWIAPCNLYIKHWRDSQLICLKHDQSVKQNLFQNITDDKLSWVQEFVEEFNQFGCRLATVGLIFLHLEQYWHLATQDKFLWACILLGSSAACNRFMAPISYYIFIISVLLQLPLKS